MDDLAGETMCAAPPPACSGTPTTHQDPSICGIPGFPFVLLIYPEPGGTGRVHPSRTAAPNKEFSLASGDQAGLITSAGG